MISLPKQPSPYQPPTWIQNNNSDVNGSLWASFGIDLSENEGKLRVGKRLLLNWGTGDDANMTSYPVGFSSIPNVNGIFTVAGGYVWQSGNNYPSSTFARLVNGSGGVSGAPTNCDSTISDIAFLSNTVGNFLFVTTNSTDVYKTADGLTWTSNSIGASGSSGRMMTPYSGRMYMASGGNTVVSWSDPSSPANSGTYTVTLGTNETITFLRSSSNRIWIGVVNLNNKAYVYEWDGTAAEVTKSYRMEANGALACVIKDDVPWVVDSNGSLLVWNGGTFIRQTSFFRKNNKLLQNALGSNNSRFIHPNGMSIINKRIHILIDGRNYDSNSTLEETIASGIWEYDDTRGLVHKYAIGQTKSGGTIQDFGQPRIAGAGALSEFNLPNTSGVRNGTFLCGASYYSDATTVTSGIFYDDTNDTLKKGGYFITTKLYAADENGLPSVQNIWQNNYVLYKKLLNSADEIVVKYRVSEADPIEATITWISSATFTTTTDVTQYWTSGTGGEVEIQNGIGGGGCSHIIGIVNNSGTYTVTVDETYALASGTAKARFQSWKKIGSIVLNNSKADGVTFDQEGMGDLTNWIQFKVCMIFTGKDEIEKMLIINSNVNPAH